MASAEPTITAPNRSKNKTERNEAVKTIASRRLLKCGLMSSQAIMLAPRSMMIAAMAGIGMTAITRARNSTMRSRNAAEMIDVMRLLPPRRETSHMRLNEAHVGSDERKGSKQFDTASEKMPFRLSVYPPTL